MIVIVMPPRNLRREKMINETTKQHSGAFIRKIGGWGKYYQFLKSQKTIRRFAPKVGRNDPCPCDSGKKNKKCCNITT